MKTVLMLIMTLSLFGSDYDSMIDSFDNGDTNRAIAFARKNATQGNASAMYDLGLLYYSNGDVQRAQDWFEKSVKKDGKGKIGIALIMFSKAEYTRVLEYLKSAKSGRMKSSLLKVSKDILENRSDASSDDYLLLGELFFKDKIVYPNARLALFLIDKSAQIGNMKAQEIMGDANNIMIVSSLEAPLLTNSLDIALKYYMKASNQGNYDAMAKMGEIHIVGPRNIRMVQRGIDFIQKSANGGSALGAKLLGDLYLKGIDFNGLGVIYDAQKSLEWYRKATGLCEVNDKLTTVQEYSQYYNNCEKESSVTPGYRVLFEEF